MPHLFNYGLSQEDARTENKLLQLAPGDRLLCIASAGEVPLNLLSMNDIDITAADTDQNQLFLSKLKLAAAINLNKNEAAGFLGFRPVPEAKRLVQYRQLQSHIDAAEVAFWDANLDGIAKGVVNRGRFEQYISRYRKTARHLLGNKNLQQLLLSSFPDEQTACFKNNRNTRLLKILFKLIFHPAIYTSNGIAAQGLSNRGKLNMADFFFNRLASFCTSNPARENYYLQYSFWGEVLFDEALPEFLQDGASDRLAGRQGNLHFFHGSITDCLNRAPSGYYNKIHLSNIGDWMSPPDFDQLLALIDQKAPPVATISARYIHRPLTIPPALHHRFTVDAEAAQAAARTDRYPFYTFVPLQYHRMV